jgi:uncharacterized protein YjaG (DUF416 family)
MLDFNIEVFEFDRYLQRLRLELSQMPEGHRIAFAAQVAQRLLPFYQGLAQFLGSPDAEAYRNILDRVWSHVLGEHLAAGEIKALLKACRALDLGEEACCEYWNPGVDAVGALWLTLSACRSESSENAAMAAGNAINRIDRILFKEFADKHHGPLDPVDSQAISEEIDRDPLILAEKRIQAEVLEFLRTHPRLGQEEIGRLRRIS